MRFVLLLGFIHSIRPLMYFIEHCCFESDVLPFLLQRTTEQLLSRRGMFVVVIHLLSEIA